MIKCKTAVNAHPWFFYVGLSGGGVSSTVNLSCNLSLGCYLLANRWDIAATFSFQGMFDEGDNTTTTLSYGLTSKVHFPIKGAKFSPEVGGQILASTSGETTAGSSTPPTTATSASFIVGACWFVGIGSIDIDFTIGNEVTSSGGYTLAPNMGKR